MRQERKARQQSVMKALSLATLITTCLLSYSTSVSAAACARSKWAEGKTYEVGDVVTFQGHNYKTLQYHVAFVGSNWAPSRTPALWKDLGECSNNQSTTSQSNQTSLSDFNSQASMSGNKSGNEIASRSRSNRTSSLEDSENGQSSDGSESGNRMKQDAQYPTSSNSQPYSQGSTRQGSRPAAGTSTSSRSNGRTTGPTGDFSGTGSSSGSGSVSVPGSGSASASRSGSSTSSQTSTNGNSTTSPGNVPATQPSDSGKSANFLGMIFESKRKPVPNSDQSPSSVSSTPPSNETKPAVQQPAPSNYQPGPGPTVSPGDFPVTQMQFDRMFPSRKPVFTYAGLLEARKVFPAFASTGDVTVRKQEIAAFFANIGHETSGLIYDAEIRKSPYCDPGSRYPCVPGKMYFGRGPLQLSWNFNYGSAGDYLKLPLLQQPDLVTSQPDVAWKAALWFWMFQTGAGRMTGHDAITRGSGFGETIRTINGAVECGGRGPDAVQDRIAYYRAFTKELGVAPGNNLGC